MFICKNTIKVSAEIEDINGNPVEPSVIKVNIYDSSYQLVESITDISNDGNYYYIYYTLPDAPGKYICEWYCEYLNNSYVKRSLWNVTFV